MKDMSRRRFLALSMGTVFGPIVGCGGGGTGGGGFSSREDSFSVGANQGANETYGAISIRFEAAGTFPAGSSLTLSQMSQAPQMPPTNNFKLGAPALKLTSTEVAQRDITISIVDDGKDYIAGIPTPDGWLPLRSTKANGKIDFTLPATLGRSSDRGSLGQVWEWVIGLVKDNLSDTNYAIKHLSGSTHFASPDTILCSHGILDNWQSMAKFAGPALAKLDGSGVFSFAFPWKAGAKEAGIQLAALLEPYKNQLKNITVIGYSQGVLVVRYALERLGATASVKECIYLMGPNLGSVLASPIDFGFNIGKFWLNANVSGSPFAVNINDPAIQEFKPGNPFLDDLNSYHGTQRGDVDYYLLNGENDWVVDANSGQAIGVRLEELTGGNIWRGTVPGATHFNIKSDVSVIDRMFNQLPLVFGNELTIIFEPPIEVYAQLNGWDFSFRVRNNTNGSIYLKDLALETYVKDGSEYATQWYDPNTPSGQFFPTNYATWGESLGAGESSEAIDIHLWPDWDRNNINNVPLNLQAKTVVLLLNGTQNGQPVKARGKLVCRYGDIRPDPAHTRGLAERNDRVGTISSFRSGK